MDNPDCLYSNNNLFDKSLIKNFIDMYDSNLSISFSDNVNHPIFDWLNKLNNNLLIQEETNHETFRALILERLLGYEFEDWIYENHPGNDSRKVEWTIKKNNSIYSVIELKGSEINLDKPQDKGFSPVEQAFNYASKSENIKWVIVSNYSEIRLYNKNNQNKFIQFDFVDFVNNNNDINEKFLKSFLLIFSKFSLVDNEIPSLMLEESLILQKDFEDGFYKLYNETRLMLIKELIISSNLEKKEAIHYAQLILNRFIFICFAESKFLIPKNTLKKTIITPIKEGNALINKSRIWIRLCELFEDLNVGNKSKKIFGFNGRLFSENLEFLHIRDCIENLNIFEKYKLGWKFDENYIKSVIDLINVKEGELNPIWFNFALISGFDFSSESTLNLLGHIFENSVSDIEYLNKVDVEDKLNFKNNKHIVYTPEQITSSICFNSIISFLSTSDFEDSIFNLIDEYNNKNNLDELYSKLINIKILDPVCGSGAFLNKAVDILFDIHSKIYDIDKSFLNNYYNISEFDDNYIKKRIIRDNIYGVDINEEFIEITKLSMLLKIVRKNEELIDLDKNFKCGNSLISDKDIDVEKAFNWEENFDEIIRNGGFDVIVGNPPYDQHEDIDENFKKYFKYSFEKTYNGNASLYVYFFEKSLDILKDNGILSFICSNKFVNSDYGLKLRKLILSYDITYYCDDISGKIFKKNVDPLIIGIMKKSSKDNEFKLLDKNIYYPQELLSEESFIFADKSSLDLREKIYKKGTLIRNYDSITIHEGIKSGAKKVFNINQDCRDKLVKKDKNNIDIIKPVLRGKNINKWRINYENEYIIFTRRGIEIDKYPYIKEYLLQYKERLMPREENDKNKEKGRKHGEYEWYELQDTISFYKDFEKPKLIWGNISESPKFAYDENNYYPDETCYFLTSDSFDLKYILALFNSKLLFWYFKNGSPKLGKKGNRSIKTQINKLPLVKSPNGEKLLIDIVEELINSHDCLSNEKIEFIEWLEGNYEVNISNWSDDFYNINFKDFFKKLKIKNKIMTKDNYIILKNEFDETKRSINHFLKRIDNNEKKLNKFVYELYDLNEDEINIIEKYFNY